MGEFEVKVSPIKFIIEKEDREYEFEPIGEVIDLTKLKLDIIDIMKRFNITVRSKNTVIIPRSASGSRQSFEETYLKSKDIIREWYKEDPDKAWSANELMEAAKFGVSRRSSIMTKLMKEKFIKCINPTKSRNERVYVKAEAMITPEAAEKRDMKKLEEERKVVFDVLG